MTRSRELDDVAAVFPGSAHARAAVVELRREGLAAEHLEAAALGSDPRVYELDIAHETMRSVARGIAVGMPLGAVAGASLVMFAVGLQDNSVPWVDSIAAGGLPGLLGGLLFGGFAGMVAAAWLSREQDRWEAVPLAEGEVLVVARAHGSPAVVQAVLERHGGMPAALDRAPPSGIRGGLHPAPSPPEALASAPTRRPPGSLRSAPLIGAALLLGVQALLVVGRGWSVFTAGAQADEIFGQAAFATMDIDAPIGTLLLLLGVVVAIAAVLLVRRSVAAWVVALGFEGLWLMHATVNASAAPLAAMASAVLAVAAVLLLLHAHPRIAGGVALDGD